MHTPQIHSGGESRAGESSQIVFREFRKHQVGATAAEWNLRDVKRKTASINIGLDFLFYSLAAAELRQVNDEDWKFAAAMRETFSHNLRHLLS